MRHEQGAAHAAEGYAMATGRVGVCMATSGPGATNLVTGIADAYMDSVPIVAITGQVSSTAVGTDAFQEADIRGITMPITKHSFLVTRAADIPMAIKEAFHIAGTGRPGPCWSTSPRTPWPPRRRSSGRRRSTCPATADDAAARQADPRGGPKMIKAASRPTLYVGGGVVKAEAYEELAELVKITQIPAGHHADGPRRVPRQPPAAHGHARHARHGGRRSAPCSAPTC